MTERRDGSTIHFRGAEIQHRDGVGWCYRFPRAFDIQDRQWRKADGLAGAKAKVLALTGNGGTDIEPVYESGSRRCIECGHGCRFRFCAACARANGKTMGRTGMVIAPNQQGERRKA